MSKLYFNIKEFTRIRGEEVFDLPDKERVQAIIEGFMLPLNDCRAAIGLPVYINSGYRPHLYELRQGRNGTSQHCFNHDPEQHDELFGACDVTSAVNEKLIYELLEQGFTRIAYYPEKDFFHVDYKKSEQTLFLSDSRSNWKPAGIFDVLEAIIE